MQTFNQLDIRTADGRYSQRDLIYKINIIATSKGYGKTVAQSTINSFVMNGIVETYNELGYQKWVEMIHQIIDHEGKEMEVRHG